MLIPAGKFKAQCLKLMDQVRETREEIIITKRGKPTAKLVAVEDSPPRPLFGFMQGSVVVNADITQPMDETWDADTDCP